MTAISALRSDWDFDWVVKEKGKHLADNAVRSFKRIS
jgi:hypothetical protein